MNFTYHVFTIAAITLIFLFYLYSDWIAELTSSYTSVCQGVVTKGSGVKNARVLADEYTLAARKAIMEIKENRNSLNSKAASPFISVNGQHRLAPKYNLATCLNEKVMCTLTQAIFCYLYDSEGFVANNKSIYLERWFGRFCEDRNEVAGAYEKHLKSPYNLLTLFMVRDPIEKFLSGYANKCLLEDSGKIPCFDCVKGDVFCAVERFHDEIMNYSSNYSSSQGPPSFNMLTAHVLPSIWRCEMFNENENYFFVKYGETADEEQAMWKTILNLFRSHGVEDDKLQYIREVVNERSLMATKSRKERNEVADKLRASAKHMQLLREVYYYDSIVFNYPLP